jgi:hypothetical protein
LIDRRFDDHASCHAHRRLNRTLARKPRISTPAS